MCKYIVTSLILLTLSGCSTSPTTPSLFEGKISVSGFVAKRPAGNTLIRLTVEYEGCKDTTAYVYINSHSVPYQPHFGVYEAEIPDAGYSTPMELLVVSHQESLSLSRTIPGGVSVISPTPTTYHPAGNELVVQWSRTALADGSFIHLRTMWVDTTFIGGIESFVVPGSYFQETGSATVSVGLFNGEIQQSSNEFGYVGFAAVSWSEEITFNIQGR
ncbi:hypothetical protein J7K18_05665 [bacterium]|nr:hypothetical protein [bacterium]